MYTTSASSARPRRKARVRAAAVAVALGSLAIGITGETANADNNGVVQLRGVAHLDFEDCGGFGKGLAGLDLKPSAEGWSLDGCLYITDITREQWNPGDGVSTYQENGTERFEGDLYFNGEPVGDGGTFDTTYQFRAKFEEARNFDTEIFGRCQHPIVSGTGVFANVEGRLDFKDVLEGPGAPYFPYRGHVRV